MRNFFDLSLEEKLRVYESNTKLQQEVSEWLIADEEDYAREMFSCVSPVIRNYCISYCGCYANGIEDVADFFVGVENMQETFCFFSDKEYNSIKRTLEVASRFYNGHFREGMFDDFFASEAEDILDDIVRKMRRMFSWKSEDEASYFLDIFECILDDGGNGEYLVDDDYRLYHIYTEKVCYA